MKSHARLHAGAVAPPGAMLLTPTMSIRALPNWNQRSQQGMAWRATWRLREYGV